MSQTAQNIPWTATATAVVAISAFMLSAISLAWQFTSWRWSGAAVKVSIDFREVVGSVTGRSHVGFITASNAGRGACQVASWWIEDGTDKSIYVANLEEGSAARPEKLDGLHEVFWFFVSGPLIENCRRKNVTRVRPVLQIGSGKKIKGKWVSIPF
ncbi:hypothetical protein ACFYXF_10110 [Streptomyces sp. NPDC002680]|uniref:hypothetical protein n=1 Tax=Streptomyces sp. NPDC002680 TaxID=3364659 RepID=UPI0036A55535